MTTGTGFASRTTSFTSSGSRTDRVAGCEGAPTASWPGRPESPRRTLLRRAAGALGLLAATGTLCFGATEAHADPVSPNGKGVVGGALLGAEVVTITESLIGVRQPWAHIVGGAVGAVGGGIGGYFVEQGSSDGRAPVLLLAGGISLIIPALVLSLNATRYQPVESGSEDNAPIGPTPEPGTVGGSVVLGGSASGQSSGTGTGASSPPATTPVVPPPAPVPPKSPGSGGPPQSVLDFGGGELRVGVPVPEVRAMYSVQQVKDLGVAQHTEYRLAMVKVTF